MLLSPLAEPFEPCAMMRNPDFAIYNQGSPALVCMDEVQVIEGISDEAISECFPPTLDEIQEMEVVEAYVEMLAVAALMEEREEIARSFGDIKKRWDARRKEGVPVGGKSRHVTRKGTEEVAGVQMVNHHRTSTDIVLFNESLSKTTHFHGDSNELVRAQNRRAPKVEKRQVKSMHRQMKPIMQPKKGPF